eukprot:4096181-Amphidinium_carterae.1
MGVTSQEVSSTTVASDTKAAPEASNVRSPSPSVHSDSEDSEAETAELASLCVRDFGNDWRQINPARADWIRLECD